MFKFNAKQAVANTDYIAIHDLRRELTSRLSEAHAKLNPNASFSRAAQKNGGGDAMMAGMLLNMLGLGALFHGLEDMLGLEHGDIGALALPAIDALELLQDDSKKKAARRMKMDLYPEGRRKDFFGQNQKPVNKKFNVVAANDCAQFDADARYEVNRMNELMDVLTQLERKGVKRVGLNPTQTVAASMRRAMAA